jgi:hypothetical protein
VTAAVAGIAESVPARRAEQHRGCSIALAGAKDRHGQLLFRHDAGVTGREEMAQGAGAMGTPSRTASG